MRLPGIGDEDFSVDVCAQERPQRIHQDQQRPGSRRACWRLVMPSDAEALQQGQVVALEMSYLAVGDACIAFKADAHGAADCPALSTAMPPARINQRLGQNGGLQDRFNHNLGNVHRRLQRLRAIIDSMVTRSRIGGRCVFEAMQFMPRHRRDPGYIQRMRIRHPCRPEFLR